MTIDDIVALTKAGYTKADIEGILNTVNQPAVPVVSDDMVEQLPEATAPGTAAPAAAVSQSELDKLSTKLDYVMNRINLMNVRGSVLEDKPKESVDDILASIINPKK